MLVLAFATQRSEDVILHVMSCQNNISSDQSKRSPNVFLNNKPHVKSIYSLYLAYSGETSKPNRPLIVGETYRYTISAMC